MVREKILLIWFFKSTGWKIKRKWGEKMRNRKSWRMTNDWLLVPISTRWTLWGILIVLKSITTIFFIILGWLYIFLLTTWLSCLLFEKFVMKKCKNTFIHHTAQIRLIFVCALCVVQAYEGCQKTILVSYWESFGLMSFCCGGHALVFYLCCFILEKILLANWECNIIVLWRPGLTCKEKRGVC